ncbi:MAG: histidine kinase [Flavobacteriales bacterium]|nr:histidine kinase [Flavobacteriales bacterium]
MYARTALIIAGLVPCAGQAQYPALREMEVRVEGARFPVSVLAEDAQGLLWLGGPKGLLRTDGARHRTILLGQRAGVTALAPADDAMIAGLSEGLVLRCTPLRTDTLPGLGPSDGTALTALTVDARGRIWAGTRDGGVRVWQDGRVLEIHQADGLPDEHVNALCAVEGLGVMVATDQGVVLFGDDLKRVVNIDASSGLPDNLVLSLCKAGGQRVWAGTYSSGPVRISFPDNSVEALDPAWPYGPVRSLVFSKGMVWAGMDGEGMLVSGVGQGSGRYVQETPRSLRKILCTITTRDGAVWWCDGREMLVRAEPASVIVPQHEGFDLSNVQAVTGDEQGRIWIVTPNGVFGHASEFSEGERMTRIALPSSEVPITSIHAVKDGSLWLGTLGRGLLHVPPSGAVRRIVLDPGSAGDNVMAIRSRGEELWLATLNGLVAVTMENGTERVVRHPLPGSGFVYDVLPMPDGSVLAATDGHGIMRLTVDGLVTPLDAMGKRTFYSLCRDGMGNVWASGPGTGLCRVDGDSLTVLASTTGLFDDAVYGITPFAGGVLMITATGVHALDPRSGRIARIDGAMPEGRIESPLNANYTASDGVIWFATDLGLVRLSPDTLAWTGGTPTLITGLMIAGEEVPVADHLELDHSRNALRIQFTGLHYAAPDHVRFVYQLTGLDPQLRTGSDREVTYGRLAPGAYTFKVRAYVEGEDPEGPWASLTIRVSPPWWRTPWAVGAAAALAAAAAFLLLRMRDRRMRAREAMEKERVRFQLEALRSQVNPHFLFNSFGTLLELIEQDKVRAAEHVERLSAFFREILQVRDKDTITVEEEIRLLRIYFSLEQARFGERIALDVRVDEQALRGGIPPLTLQLLVENALKHNAVSQEAPLRIEVLSKDGDLLVRNPIRPRQSRPVSSHFGLESIRRRYHALTDRPVTITATDGVFEVRVPLIHPHA